MFIVYLYIYIHIHIADISGVYHLGFLPNPVKSFYVPTQTLHEIQYFLAKLQKVATLIYTQSTWGSRLIIIDSQ